MFGWSRSTKMACGMRNLFWSPRPFFGTRQKYLETTLPSKHFQHRNFKQGIDRDADRKSFKMETLVGINLTPIKEAKAKNRWRLPCSRPSKCCCKQNALPVSGVASSEALYGSAIKKMKAATMAFGLGTLMDGRSRVWVLHAKNSVGISIQTGRRSDCTTNTS